MIHTIQELKQKQSMPLKAKIIMTENRIRGWYNHFNGNVFQKEGTYRCTGLNRTGCVFCMFGVQLEKRPNRFERLKKTNPKYYDYCINKLELNKVLDYIGVDY